MRPSGGVARDMCVCCGEGGTPGESIELWEGTNVLLTGKSQASVISDLFLGGKYLIDAFPYWGCSLAVLGGEPQLLASLQGTTFLKHFSGALWVGCTCTWVPQPQGLVGFWFVLAKCKPRVRMWGGSVQSLVSSVFHRVPRLRGTVQGRNTGTRRPPCQ